MNFASCVMGDATVTVASNGLGFAVALRCPKDKKDRRRGQFVAGARLEAMKGKFFTTGKLANRGSLSPLEAVMKLQANGTVMPRWFAAEFAKVPVEQLAKMKSVC